MVTPRLPALRALALIDPELRRPPVAGPVCVVESDELRQTRATPLATSISCAGGSHARKRHVSSAFDGRGGPLALDPFRFAHESAPQRVRTIAARPHLRLLQSLKLPKNVFWRNLTLMAGGTAAGQAFTIAASPILSRL